LDFCAFNFDLEEITDIQGIDNLASLGFEEEPSESNLYEELSAISLGQYLNSKPASNSHSEDKLINANIWSISNSPIITEGLKLGVKDSILGYKKGIDKN